MILQGGDGWLVMGVEEEGLVRIQATGGESELDCCSHRSHFRLPIAPYVPSACDRRLIFAFLLGKNRGYFFVLSYILASPYVVPSIVHM